jgi:hypothetical protein
MVVVMAFVRRSGLFLVSYAPLSAMFVAAKWPTGSSGRELALLALWVLGVASLLVLPLASAFFTRGRRKQTLAAASLVAGALTAVGTSLEWYEPAAWHAPAKATHATTAAGAFGLCVAGIEIALVILLNARQTSQLYWRISDPRDQGGAVAGYLATYLLPLLSFDAHGWNSVVAYGIYLLVLYVIFVRSENLVLVNPTLYVLGLRIFDVQLEPPGGVARQRRVLLLSRDAITKPTDVSVLPLGDECYLAAKTVEKAA